ncbi:MAG: ribonuclease H-like domain-containing protein [Pseudomonadota bacterium]
MLKNTFLHIPGIGTKTERRLWESGVHHWRDIAEDCPVRLARPRLNSITRCLKESRHHLETNNPNYFSDLLPSGLHWRFFPEFRNSTVYLDIETTGLDSWENEITTIALYNGSTVAYYINGRNLNDFLHDYQRNRNEKALETLLAYNIQDVLTLEKLMVIAYNIKIKDTPFYGSPLALPILPGIPFNVDMETVRRIDFDMRTNLL